jgi:hypothetical protein
MANLKMSPSAWQPPGILQALGDVWVVLGQVSDVDFLKLFEFGFRHFVVDNLDVAT